jgi:hypothetical protein
MTPSTMAPTKANAIYAVTTLNLLTKVMGSPPLVHVVPAITPKVSKAFPAEKVSVAVTPRDPHSRPATATW